MLKMQSGELRTLTEFLAEMDTARGANVARFDVELQMASLVFEVGQHVYVNTPMSDRPYSKVIASLLAASIRYYATSVDLCLRGHPAEGLAIMRSSVEHAAYLVKVANDPGLAEAWIRFADLTKAERRAHFGTDAELMKQEAIKDAAAIYAMLSVFGTHARIMSAEQTIDFDHPFGWRIRTAETGTEHVRLFLLGVVFAMRGLLVNGIIPKLLEERPPSLAACLDHFAELHSNLGTLRKDFRAWLQDPRRSRAALKVAAIRTIALDIRK